MGWETRRGQGYYRKTRVGSRVVSRYYGGGAVAQMKVRRLQSRAPLFQVNVTPPAD